MRAREFQAAEEKSFRVYVTESIRLAAQNKYYTQSWLDVTKSLYAPVDSRTGDEIALSVLKAAGLSFAGGEKE